MAQWTSRGAAAALVLTLAACGAKQDSGEGTAVEASSPTAPDIGPSAAPGVAFSYGYDFKVDDARISALQETHAAACERLGLAKCRIVGLDYSIDGNDEVSGMLRVKLDPLIARQFGKDGVASAEQAGGKLVNARFSGEDEGSAIKDAGRQQASVKARIAELEKRLATLGAGDAERAELQRQLDELRSEAAETADRIAAGEEKLANTPMTFNYYGKGGIPGFGNENPLTESWRLLIASGVTLISYGLKFIAVVLPWVLLLILLALAYRSRMGRAVRRWWSRPRSEDAPAA